MIVSVACWDQMLLTLTRFLKCMSSIDQVGAVIWVDDDAATGEVGADGYLSSGGAEGATPGLKEIQTRDLREVEESKK